MIKTFILFYLNIKPTHGYEIQKYIQINHMDSWTKIQSGSIYYALSKLEKESSICLLREEKIGTKIRKVYQITEKGREELQEELKAELDRDIYDIGSDKFIIFPILSGIEKKVLVIHIVKHIEGLERRKSELLKWQKIKINQQSLKIESLCFEMMISSLDYQIKWHETLLAEIDSCMNLSKQISDFIKEIDFSSVETLDTIMEAHQQGDIERLRQEILSNPTTAAEKLEELIGILKK